MLSAERASGCKLDLDLSSANTVIRQRGTISGALPKDGGFYFDGTNDYIQYILGSEFYSDAISYVIEFTPEFNWNENVGRTFFGCSFNHLGTGRILLFKYDAATNYDLLFQMNITWIQIPSASYSAYWKQNCKNTIVISATGATTTIYLNGNLIANATPHVWSKLHRNILNLGCSYTEPNAPFKGLIHSFKIYSRALSDQECLDYCNNSTFLYEQRATLILPMRLQDHDSTNLRTLDVSSHGYHATFGDGLTPTTYPTKISGKRGYSFDGGDYLKISNAGINSLFSGKWTTSMTWRSNYSGYYEFFSKDMDASNYIQMYCDYTINRLYYYGYIGGLFGFTVAINIGRSFQNNMNLIVSSEITSGFGMLNGRIVTGTFTRAFNNNGALKIGKIAGGSGLRGEYKDFRAWDGIALTQIQCKDLYIKLLQDINHE